MPDSISSIVSVIAQEVKKPQHPIGIAGIDPKTRKAIIRPAQIKEEQLPEEEKDYKGEYSGQEADDALVAAGILDPLPKKLLGLQ